MNHSRQNRAGRPLRLLFVSLNFAPELTATGKYTGEMAQWFAARGHAVDAIAGLPHYPEWVVAPSYRGRGFFRESLAHMSVLRTPHTVPNPAGVTAGARIRMEVTFTVASLYWWLRILVQRSRYDVVIAVCPPMQDAVMPWLYGLLRGVPWVFHIQDFQVDAAMRLGMLRGKGFARFLYVIENFLVKRATRVSTITPAMQRRAVEKGAAPERTWLVPNWADVPAVTPGPADNGFRRELAVAPGEVLVMYAGGMGAKQGLDLVVKAAAALCDRTRLRFVMIGTGADRLRLEALSRQLKLTNLQFLPVQPLERLPEMLAAGDVHLIVQRAEAADLVMPSKLTNILAAGRPCIATAGQGTALQQILTQYDCGVAVEPESVDALCSAVSQLAADHPARERMGLNARTYAEEHLDQDVILGDFEEKLIALTPTRTKK